MTAETIGPRGAERSGAIKPRIARRRAEEE